MTSTALICGVSGQDGAYLARLLRQKGYRVVGTSRDAQLNTFGNLQRLGIAAEVDCRSMNLLEFRSVIQVLSDVSPDEVYNLAGQSSVGLSFDQPVETLASVAHGTLNLLEAVRFLGRPIRLYNAGSSECFGETTAQGANEETAFRPRSPYAVAKAAAFWQVANYREAYRLHACSGILFNHESPLRPERFVTQKIVRAACRIAQGSKERLRLGNLDVHRDWGWAPEYVDAMWRMLQQERPEDYVIGTGETHSLQHFTESVFAQLNLKAWDHIDALKELVRPADIRFGRADPSRARERLGWRAESKMHDVARMMVEAERRTQKP
jgi:GDPmannose 4,6-dehydratase